jgi:hypothetical protein
MGNEHPKDSPSQKLKSPRGVSDKDKRGRVVDQTDADDPYSFSLNDDLSPEIYQAYFSF